MPDSSIVTIQDVADIFQVTRRTVQSWIKKGLLPQPTYIRKTAFYTSIPANAV